MMDFNNNTIHKQHIIFGSVIALLAVSTLFFASLYLTQVKQTQHLQQQLANQQVNVKVVSFLNLFIEKVLRSNTEVSFEDRLQLENAIRNIDDPDLLSKWEQFTGGTNESQIQQGVKDLLAALAKKISY